MGERLASGYRYRLRCLLELAGVDGAQARAAEIVADAGLRSREGAGTIEGLLEEQCGLWQRRALTAAAAAGLSAPLAALRRRAIGAGGCLAEAPRFYCDGSLVGLARWLRASGKEASASPGVPALELLTAASQACGLLLTTDHRILEFGAVRDGRLPTLWVPSSVTALEQLRMLIGDLALTREAPRCMGCGGTLLEVRMEEVRARIPPRTAAWLTTYSACETCGQLYWPGTHWARIVKAVDEAFAEAQVARG